MQQATAIMRDATLQRRRPVWFAAVQSILQADVEGLERALAQIGNVNAAINGGTLLQLALEAAFPGDLVPNAAALDRGLACIRAILDHGADPNRTYSGIPPLVFALLRAVCPAVRLLIKRGAIWTPFSVDGRRFGAQSDFEWRTLNDLVRETAQFSQDCARVLTNYRCDGCRQKFATKRCGQCMQARYCCVECQREHWRQHRVVCRA